MPTRAVDIHFFKPGKKRSMKEAELKNHEEQKKHRLTEISDPTPQLHPSKVYSELFADCPTAAVFTVLPGFEQPSQPSVLETESNLPKSLFSLYSPEHKKLSDAELKVLCDKTIAEIEVAEDEAEFLQEATQLQSQSLVWHEYRKGRITASHFHDVNRHMVNGKCFPTSLVKRIMQYSPVPDIPALKWGRENEDKARSEYVLTVDAKHQNTLVVDDCGLVVDPQFSCLGASPDGLVTCDCHNSSVLEIKCPYKYRNQLPTCKEALADPSYCLKVQSGRIHLTKSHKYYHQVQGQIALCNLEYCDFVVWTTKGIFVERIECEKSYSTEVIPMLSSFFEKYMLPELLTHSLESGTSSQTDSDDEILYCVCRKPESGRMIACDSQTCSGVWFHYSCVGLKRKPRGKWYCPKCKK